MRALLILLALASAGAPPAAADEGCDNHGAIVQAGGGNRYACAGPCRNHGAIVMLGPGNRYDCSGPCDNEGFVVNLGGSHCGDTDLKACNGSQCISACPRTQQGCPPHRPAPLMPPPGSGEEAAA